MSGLGLPVGNLLGLHLIEWLSTLLPSVALPLVVAGVMIAANSTNTCRVSVTATPTLPRR